MATTEALFIATTHSIIRGPGATAITGCHAHITVLLLLLLLLLCPGQHWLSVASIAAVSTHASTPTGNAHNALPPPLHLMARTPASAPLTS